MGMPYGVQHSLGSRDELDTALFRQARLHVLLGIQCLFPTQEVDDGRLAAIDADGSDVNVVQSGEVDFGD